MNHFGLDSVIPLCLRAGKARILAATFILLSLVGLADWSVGPTVSLAVLYILPMMLGSVVLSRIEIGLLAVLCSLVRARFDVPSSPAEVLLRFLFASVAYFSSGLFVAALVRNRALAVEHLKRIEREQALRREAEENLQVLVESSPAAILTLDSQGVVLAANHAAEALFAVPEGHALAGRQISKYLPVLFDALRLDVGTQTFRTAAQCQGTRENGEIFHAHTWFSSYRTSRGMRLAAIVVDSSEEMRDREEQNFHHLMKHNRIAASAVAHEVRNLCGALSMLTANLGQKHDLAADEDYLGLASLIGGMEQIASLELRSRVEESIVETPLQFVLDHLRIMIESEFLESGGSIIWQVPKDLPPVVADAQGLLQAFLNLANNSLRAMRDREIREFRISVGLSESTVQLRFVDSGPGIACPEKLFQPFQPGADGAGLGLYVSRALVRSYGGDLRYEPVANGSCFVVDLQVA